MFTAAAGSLSYAAGIFAVRLEARARIETETDLAAACARHVGTAHLEDPAQQDRLHLAQRGAHDAPSLLADSSVTIVSSLSSVVSYAVALWLTWPGMLAALFVAAVPMGLLQRRMSSRAILVAERATESYRWRDYYANLFSAPSSARDMRLHGAEKEFTGRLRSHLSTALGEETRQRNRTSAMQVAFTLVNGLIAGAAAATIAVQVSSGRVSVGAVVLFSTAVLAVQTRLATLIGVVGRVKVSLGIFAHLLDYVGAVEVASVGVTEAAPLRTAIEVRDVWFRYGENDPWVLSGVSTKLIAGETNALVGLNGAGKSTLVKLLLRFVEPTAGAILWDGQDIRTLDPRSLRNRIACVLQDFTAYELTALENITIGDLDHFGDRDRARRAADTANAATVINGMTDGLDTMLSVTRNGAAGQRGSTLSGGQWQRIALARAVMLEHADLLILDEPNAGLDPEAEHRLSRELFSLGTGRTRLLISHRLGGVRLADQIIVLQAGRVVEQGTHDQLMSEEGEYARLFRLQASDFAEPRVAG